MGLGLWRRDKKKQNLSSGLEIDPNFLRKLFHDSRMDTINVEYEWFNYTLAQFWHTYSDWIDEYVRMQIEQAVGSMKFLKLEECTLGKVGLAKCAYTKPCHLDVSNIQIRLCLYKHGKICKATESKLFIFSFLVIPDFLRKRKKNVLINLHGRAQ